MIPTMIEGQSRTSGVVIFGPQRPERGIGIRTPGYGTAM